MYIEQEGTCKEKPDDLGSVYGERDSSKGLMSSGTTAQGNRGSKNTGVVPVAENRSVVT